MLLLGPELFFTFCSTNAARMISTIFGFSKAEKYENIIRSAAIIGLT